MLTQINTHRYISTTKLKIKNKKLYVLRSNKACVRIFYELKLNLLFAIIDRD